MIYNFKDEKGTFTLKNPQKYNLYFPLTDKEGRILSSISPNLSGDIKKDNEHFLTQPISVEDIRSNALTCRDFFIKSGDEIIRLSNPYDDTLECGFLYHNLIKETKKLRIEVLNFVPHNLNVEIMRIKIHNKSEKEIKFTPTSFIPIYARSEKNLRDHRHVSSLLNRIELDKNGIYVKPTMIFDEHGHRENKTIYFVLGFENNAKILLGQFPTLDYFYGEGNLSNPEAITKNIAPVNKKITDFDGKEACAAFRFSEIHLKPGQESVYCLAMGIEEDKNNIKKIFAKANSLTKVEKLLEETKNYWQDSLSNLDFDFKNTNYNGWLKWVKLQPTLRKLFGCSFLPHFDYGKGGRGWRDLWQDALTLILTEPEKARSLLLHNFKGIRIDGSNATVISKEGDFIPDRNRINRVWMDHGVWPYLTLNSYIHKSADFEILLEELPYFRDCQLKRAKEIDTNFSQEHSLLRAKDAKVYTGSVLEHILVQTIVQFFNVGKHNIIRLENADWNDGLDMAAQNGESVVFSFMYAHNLENLCVLLEELKKKTKSVYLLKELKLLLDKPVDPVRKFEKQGFHKKLSHGVNYNSYKEKQKRLKEYFEKTVNISGEKIKIDIDELISDLKAKSRHMSDWLKNKEWLKIGFFNGYYDNKSKRAEGKINGKIRMMLSPQVFAIMSGVASNSQIKETWKSIKKYLYNKKYGGFRLNTNFGSLYLDLGRAFGFSYGDKENGATFCHMSIMLANALYKRGFTKEGFEVINSLYQMASSENAKIYPLIPEYFNAYGRGLYLYLTGSASWYIYTLLEETLGIKFNCGDLVIEPKLLLANFFKDNIETLFTLEGKQIKVNFIKAAKTNDYYRIKEVMLDNKKIISENGKYLIKRKELLAEGKVKVIKAYLY